MEYSIQREYSNLLLRRQAVNQQLQQLPLGYISQKTIKGRKQYYLQHRSDGKVTGIYLKSTQVAKIQQDLEYRRQCVCELRQIERRMAQLEQAAKLIGQNLFCHFMVMELCAGMDELPPEKKRSSIAFGRAMNAVEGVFVSQETAAEIEKWHQGDKSFLSVYEETLRRYGFPLEVTE